MSNEARRAIRTQLDLNFFIEAAAGTGKTYELIQRAIALLASGKASIDKLAVITFTEKAAGELKLRLRTELDQARSTAEGASKNHLEDAIAKLEEATIDTIHGFCRDILRAHPIEAGIDPFFEIEADGARHASAVFRAWFTEKLSAPPPGLERFLSRGRSRTRDRTPTTELEQSAYNLLNWRDLPAPWPQPTLDLEAECHHFEQEVSQLARQLKMGSEEDPLRVVLSSVEDLDAQLDETRSLAEREAQLILLHKSLESIFGKRTSNRGSAKLGYGPYSDTQTRPSIIAAARALEKNLKFFIYKIDQHLSAELREELRDVEQRYIQRLRQSGHLDFQDLLLLSRDIIRDNPTVRHALQLRFDHILVDEFQDTDPIQAEIILLLAAEDPAVNNYLEAKPHPGKLTLVGDPKQSIYGFRRADLNIYSQVRTALAERGVKVVQLQNSLRSVLPLQALINAAFELPFNTNPNFAPGYVALEGGPPAIENQPSVVALPVANPFDRFDSVSPYAIARGAPEVVGGFVEWLLRSSDWRVRDAQGTRNVEASDICLLFRSIQRSGELLTQPFESQLQSRGIDTVLIGARALHNRDEVETILTALQAIEWPGDELAMYGTLKGPLFSFTDTALYRWREEHGALHPFRSLNPDKTSPEAVAIADALKLIKQLSKHRNRRPFPETIQTLLRETRAHVQFGLQPGGARVLAHVERIIDLARRYEGHSGISFRGLVHYLRAEASEPRTQEGVVNESSVPGVRMMTVHKSKGLEFPIVIMADASTPVRTFASQYVSPSEQLGVFRLAGLTPKSLVEHRSQCTQREQSESLRLAYVASTRARDLLVIPSAGPSAPDIDKKSWLGPILRALRPPLAEERNPQPHPALPEFGPHSLSREVANAPPNIKPGVHLSRTKDYTIAWWDPNVLPHVPPPSFGLRNEQFLASGSQADTSIKAYEKWYADHQQAKDAGIEQSIVLEDLRVPPSSSSAELMPIAPSRSIQTSKDALTGARYSLLIHRVLRDIRITSTEKEVQQVVTYQGRYVSASEAEIKSATTSILAYLADDIAQRARNASICHQNYPIVGLSPLGTTIDTSITMLFCEGSPPAEPSWVAVDCTTRDLPEAQLQSKMRHVLSVLSHHKIPVRGGVLLRL